MPISQFKSLKEKVKRNCKDITAYIIFLTLSLRVVTWFEYPRILLGGDFRIPLNKEVFAKRAFYTWNEIDFGLPSIYPPRLLDPLYFLITLFQNLQLDLYTSELSAIIVIHFLASVLMYKLIKLVTNGDHVASFVGTVFVTSNVYLVNDREITAITFVTNLLIIFPSLLTFIKGIKKRSYTLCAISAILFNLSYATYPNYRTTLICFLTLILFSLYLFITDGLNFELIKKKKIRKALSVQVNLSQLGFHLKYWLTFTITLLISSLWIIVITAMNLDSLMSAYRRLAIPEFITAGLKLYDIMRLIVKWSFYQGALNHPYVPYKDVYLHNFIMIILSYIPIIIASSSLLTKKNKKMSVYFTTVVAISLILSSGFSFSPRGNALYRALTEFPLLNAFREPTYWAYFFVISLSMLIGHTVSALNSKYRNKLLIIIIITLVCSIFLYTSYPLTTGDVSRNWLNPQKRGSYFPPSYTEIDNAISSKYWTILLPQRGTYVIYNFSGETLGCGNPYSFIFSKPIISGAGTEYVESVNLDLLNKVYELILANECENVAPQGQASASSVENERRRPICAIDGDYGTRWASALGMPQWIEIEWNETKELSKIKIFFESAYANDYIIETWNGSSWVTQIEVKNNTSFQPEYTFSQLTPTTKLRIKFTRALSFNMVSIWELEAYIPTEGVSKFLGTLGIKYLVLEKNIVLGNLSSISDMNLYESKNFVLNKNWDEIALFENKYAQEKLFVAINIVNISSPNDMYKFVERLEWETIKNSVFTNATNINNHLIPPNNFTWKEISPTRFEAEIDSQGPFIIVLLESFDRNWKLYINGMQLMEENHFIANGYANGWLINMKGKLSIVIEYESQKVFALSIAITIVLLTILLSLLNIKQFKKWTASFIKA